MGEGLKILGLGKSVPQYIVKNNDFSEYIDTDDSWIKARTGIEERRFVKPLKDIYENKEDEKNQDTNVTLAYKAAKNALENSGINKDDIEVCIVATFTPDKLMPSVSCGVANLLNLSKSTLCFDLNAACSGFLYALKTAHSLLSKNKYAVVIGSEVTSKFLDMKDRSTCVLFGDGAGAVVIEKNNDNDFFFVAGYKPDKIEDSVLDCKLDNKTIDMIGSEVFRFAVETIPECFNSLLEKANVTNENVDKIVCHQANRRIIEASSKRLNIDINKFFINLHNYGNTSAASIPLALYELNPKKGEKIVCLGFGAGLTFSGAMLTI
ncbi:MAG: 3-oxoacyl-ACP synthase III family protein [Oscillospiraceae bacterium]